MTKRFLVLVAGGFLLVMPPTPPTMAEEPVQGEVPPAVIVPDAAASEAAAPGTSLEDPAPTVATIRITVENVRAGEGTVWVALCDTDLSVEGCPEKKSAPASAEIVEIMFENVAPGVYAVAGYQDLNDDNEFDRLLGVPREPYALSGAAGEQLVPTFESAALPFAAGDDAVTIRMKGLIGS